jgi:K+-transporting ATPase KdpF subunit
MNSLLGSYAVSCGMKLAEEGYWVWEDGYAGCGVDSSHGRICRFVCRVCLLLRSREMRNRMSLESMVMIAVSVVTAVYLVYALLRPENF